MRCYACHVGDDFEAKARAFHRTYTRRRALAYAIVGVVLAIGGAVTLLWVLLSSHQPNPNSIHTAQYQLGQWIQLGVFAGGAVLVGIGLIVKAVLLARNPDQPADDT